MDVDISRRIRDPRFYFLLDTESKGFRCLFAGVCLVYVGLVGRNVRKPFICIAHDGSDDVGERVCSCQAVS